jgi:hypothetical protein
MSLSYFAPHHNHFVSFNFFPLHWIRCEVFLHPLRLLGLFSFEIELYSCPSHRSLWLLAMSWDNGNLKFKYCGFDWNIMMTPKGIENEIKVMHKNHKKLQLNMNFNEHLFMNLKRPLFTTTFCSHINFSSFFTPMFSQKITQRAGESEKSF